MNVFNKLKFFYASCHFCQEKGMCLSANQSNQEIAVCEECTRKLIVGVTAALTELARMNAEHAAEVAEAVKNAPPMESPQMEVTPDQVPEVVEVAQEATEAETVSAPSAAEEAAV